MNRVSTPPCSYKTCGEMGQKPFLMDDTDQVQRMPPLSHVGKVLSENIGGLVLSGAIEELKYTFLVRVMEPGD